MEVFAPALLPYFHCTCRERARAPFPGQLAVQKAYGNSGITPGVVVYVVVVVWSCGRLVVWSFGRLGVWSCGRLPCLSSLSACPTACCLLLFPVVSCCFLLPVSSLLLPPLLCLLHPVPGHCVPHVWAARLCPTSISSCHGWPAWTTRHRLAEHGHRHHPWANKLRLVGIGETKDGPCKMIDGKGGGGAIKTNE